MPKLVRLYIQSIAVGFGLSCAFVAALVLLDVAGLRGLILGSEMGMVAAAMLVVFNGIIFAGAQFAYVIMRLADRDEGPRGGHGQMNLRPVPVAVPARKGTLDRQALRRQRQ